MNTEIERQYELEQKGPVVCFGAMHDGSTDEQLMLLYGEGDTQAFAVLYERHKGATLRYFLRHGLPRAIAEEQFQELWTAVIRSSATYQVTARFSTWLYRMAHNRLVDYWRFQGRSELSADEHNEDSQLSDVRTPERHALAHEQLRRLGEALASLPAEQRDAFLLKEEGGMSLDEIAATIGINRETAKSRLRYAFTKLKAALGGES